jgi:hypothetical protein
MIMRYASAAAFRQALEAHVRQRSHDTGLSIVRLRKGATFNRLLARLLDVAPDRWVLKGALALDFRLGAHARATLDMDLGRDDDAEAATADLLAAQERDLGDFFTFGVERTDRLDALREGAAVRYHVHAELAGRTFEHVIVDVGFSERQAERPDRRAELITAPDLLGFAGIAPLVVPVITLDHHVAEKLHAYTRGYGSTGQVQSTRVKDLIDLVLIAALASVDAERVTAALVEVFSVRGLQAVPPAFPRPPSSWQQPYATLARTIGLPPDLEAGHARVATFLNPILGPMSLRGAVWDPARQRWVVPGDQQSSQ